MTGDLTCDVTLGCLPAATQSSPYAGELGQSAAEAASVAFKALAEPLRLRMLSMIASDPRGETCVCDLQSLGEVTQPTISHHLRVLRAAGLLASERRGTWVWYRIVPERAKWVTGLLSVLANEQVAQSVCATTAESDFARELT